MMNKYAIIAGTGDLPVIIAKEIGNAKIIGFDSDKPKIKTHLLTNLGAIGKILEFLKDNEINKIIFAGGIKRPNLKRIKPDKEGAILLAKITANKIFNGTKGDDFVLSKITSFLESKGYEIVPAEKAIKNLKTPKGLLTKQKPSKQQMQDVEFGITASRTIGKLDVGQSVVVEDAIILALEAAEGTAALIKRAGQLKKSYGGVLVKCSKPNQDRRVDLPAIGIKTIEQLKNAGLTGVALEAEKSIIIDRKKVIKAANDAGLFIVGI